MTDIVGSGKSGDIFATTDNNVYVTVRCGNKWTSLWLHLSSETLVSGLSPNYETQRDAMINPDSDMYLGNFGVANMKELEKILLSTVRE